jgi:hypothetical protein
MKVHTSLKSGNIVDDASRWVNQGASAVGKFFTTAEHQARNVTGSAWDAARSTYQAFKNWVASW